MNVPQILRIQGFLQILGISSFFVLLAYCFSIGNYWLLLFSYLYFKIVVALLGNQIAQHRYINHESFKTNKLGHYFLTWISVTTGMSPLIYAIVHDMHHRYGDTAQDPHSPRNGIFHSMFGWMTQYKKYMYTVVPVNYVRNKTLLYVHRYGLVYFISLIFLISVLNWKIGLVILAGIGWNILHMGFIRTSLLHIKIPGSYRNFDTPDDSQNHRWLHLYDLGEGLHNNHTQYPNRYNQAIKPGEFDFAGWITEKIFVKG